MAKKHTKKALFTSVMSLVLCFAMLVGTTFAWFTDSVTSGNNIIKSGNLDVEMYYADGIEDPTTVEWKDASKEAIFNYDLWEPGYTEVRHIKISNVGNLALKYQLQLNANGDVTALTDAIDVYYMDPAVQVSSRTALNESNKLGTLTAVLAEMSKTASGTLEADKDVNVTLALKMRETAGNEYKNLSIGSEFSVVLHATQLTSEEDSFGSDYDAYAGLPWDGETVTEALVADEDGVYHITSAADLVAMMNDSKYPNCNKYQKVVLETNINLGGHTVSGFGDDSGFFDGIFDGQGYTISNFTIDASNRTYYAGLFNQVSQYSDENTVIKNLTVKGATVIGFGQVGVIAGGMNGNTVVDNCKVINCTAIGVKKVGAVVGYTAGGTVTNNYAENCTVLYSEKEGAEILGYENTGSTVSGNSFNNVIVAKSTSDATDLQNTLNDGGKVFLSDDIKINKIDLTKVTNDVYIDAGNHNITTSDVYGIEVAATGKNITIANANIEMTKAGDYITYAAGFKVSNGDYNNSTITLQNCKITMANRDWAYGVNMPASVKNLNLVIDNCEIEGAVAIQCWGDNNTITVTDSKLISNYDITAQYTSYCVALQDDGSTYSENNTLVIENCEFAHTGNNELGKIYSVGNNGINNSVTVTNCTYGEKVTAYNQ